MVLVNVKCGILLNLRKFFFFFCRLFMWLFDWYFNGVLCKIFIGVLIDRLGVFFILLLFEEGIFKWDVRD